ncbi:alpha/beta fold hydrolase [Actinocrispum wychmicini]|uniref:Pimeloyl-ACP methyl ester carboxylesterase n=1 Tax=Actinocrispum wychmicini TaxID=1213861 RepID=A0A4V2S4M3_9PSEU|nr:alpha/beta hydrolase [Actinocrispum wychmicini]TCO48790.1 pimeloyl-ACP methyl ester carboxylesterase [Actinocrispum wychmicini]
MPSTVVSPDGTVIGYETLGEGPPLVLVHGGTATRIRWAPVQHKLAARYKVYLMDRRGRGLSTNEGSAYSLKREAEDVAAVAEAAGGDVYVVGHSYGALVTIEAALLHGFRRIMLYEPPMESPGLPVVSRDALARLQALTDPAELLDGFYREALHLPQAMIDTMKGTEVWAARVTAAFTILRELDEVIAFAADSRLAEIKAPVRMLLGTESPGYVRAATANIAAQIPGSNIVALQGQAHQAIDTDPDQFVGAILAFDQP